MLKSTGSICWQVGNYVEQGEVFPLDIFYYSLFKKQGLYLRNRIIWHFEHGLHASKRFSGRYETLLWFTKSKEYTFNLDSVRVPSKYPGKRHYKGEKKGQPSSNPRGKNPSDVWQIARERITACFISREKIILYSRYYQRLKTVYRLAKAGYGRVYSLGRWLTVPR